MSEFKKLAFSGLMLEGGGSLCIIVAGGVQICVYRCGRGPDLCKSLRERAIWGSVFGLRGSFYSTNDPLFS